VSDDIVNRLRVLSVSDHDHLLGEYWCAYCISGETANEIERLRAQVAELRRDQERLEWMENALLHGWELEDWRPTGYLEVCFARIVDGQKVVTPEAVTLRAAIDAARAEIEK